MKEEPFVLTVNLVGVKSAVHLQAAIVFPYLIGFWLSSTKNLGGERKEHFPILHMLFLREFLYTNEPQPAPTNESIAFTNTRFQLRGVWIKRDNFEGDPDLIKRKSDSHTVYLLFFLHSLAKSFYLVTKRRPTMSIQIRRPQNQP